MIEHGQYNELVVKSKSKIGLYLGDGGEDVLLPIRYAPENISVGDRLDVFVYLDNENRPIATTMKPLALVGEFAFLTVKEMNEFGAFLDWGIDKDLFVPYSEQRIEMKRGNQYLVFVFIDERSGRIAATSKWKQHINEDNSDLKEGDEVELIIADKTDLGYKAIINQKHEGLLYQNEIFEPLQSGEIKRGYIKLVREDGKIDLSLQQQGYEHIEDLKSVLLHQLKKSGGVLALGDKSSPDEIYSKLKISKKAFKKTIGGLFKERLITINDHEIVLLKSGD